MRQTLFDRADDYAALRRLLAAGADPIAVRGAPGVGVTALLDALLDSARGGGLSGHRLVVHRAGDAEWLAAMAEAAGVGREASPGPRGGLVVLECVGSPADEADAVLSALVADLTRRGFVCILEGPSTPADVATRVHRIGGVGVDAARLLCAVELAHAVEAVPADAIERLWRAVDGNPGALRLVCARLREGLTGLDGLLDRLGETPAEARGVECARFALSGVGDGVPPALWATLRGPLPRPLATLLLEGRPGRVEALCARHLLQRRGPEDDVVCGRLVRRAALADTDAGEQVPARLEATLAFARLVVEHITDPREARRLVSGPWPELSRLESMMGEGPKRQVLRFELARLAALAGLGANGRGLVDRIVADPLSPVGADKERLKVLGARISLIEGRAGDALLEAADVATERSDLPPAARRELADALARLRIDAAERLAAEAADDERVDQALGAAAEASPQVSAALRDEALMALAGRRAARVDIAGALRALERTSAARGEGPASERRAEVFVGMAECAELIGDGRADRFVAAATRAASAHPVDGALALRLARLLHARGSDAAGQSAGRWAEQAAQTVTLAPADRARAMVIAGAAARAAEREAQAGGWFEAAVRQADAAGALAVAADARAGLAVHLLRTGLWSKAAEMARAAVALRARHAATGDPAARFSPARRLADLESFVEQVLTYDSRPERAVEWLGAIIAMAAEQLDPALSAAALRCRGALALRAGHHAPARRDLHRARALAALLALEPDPVFEALLEAASEGPQPPGPEGSPAS